MEAKIPKYCAGHRWRKIYELHNQRDTLLKEKEALSCRLDELRGIKIGYDVATQCDL